MMGVDRVGGGSRGEGGGGFCCCIQVSEIVDGPADTEFLQPLDLAFTLIYKLLRHVGTKNTRLSRLYKRCFVEKYNTKKTTH